MYTYSPELHYTKFSKRCGLSNELVTTSFNQSGPGEVDKPIAIAFPSIHSSIVYIVSIHVHNNTMYR